MPSNYTVVFTRYKSGEGRVISAPVDISAENFEAATKRAHDMLKGMCFSDKGYVYAIVSIGTDSYAGRRSEYAFDIFRVDDEEEDAE